MSDQDRWNKFLREQYPPGTRIRLQQMNDPYAPVPPGTLGTVRMVDDAGQIHMAWDNGRSLALIPGEDSFAILPPPTKLMKLYMPMTVDCYEQDELEGFECDPYELSDNEAIGYIDQIAAMLQRERNRCPEERGLMEYYHQDDGVKQKVQSLNFTAEVRDGRLWGVAECMVQGELKPGELVRLKEYVSGQASDGLGESAEQQPIVLSRERELFAHLWNSNGGWFIQTEQELFSPKLAPGLPEICFSVLPGEGKLICVKRGESGYYPSDWDTGNAAKNRELADYNNENLGVTPAQERAMLIGSMMGWSVPGADPAAYEREPERNQKYDEMEMG